VTVRVAGDEGQVLLEVIDTGIGIPPEAAAIIFEDFRQVRSVAAGRPSGTGLGLAISRRLVQMQGGSIGFESEPGKGSRFWFTIPRARARGGAATAPQPHVSEGVATAESDGHVDARTAAAASTPRAEGAPPQLEDLRRALGSATEPAEHLVLVIDDDVSVRRLIVRRLNEAGFRTAEAEDAEAGLDMARSLQPDAITLDLVMPRLDGWSALRRLKSDPATAAIPVVILTILDEGEAALEIGASAYVHKPFSGPALAAVVDNGDLARTLQRAIDESGVRRASSPIG
jgi:CheY-like chemotaxis protein